MSYLRIPDSGLLLEGSGSKSATSLPAQAFSITLSDNVIEDMIKCVQSGEDIQLSLGSSPTLLYGSNSERLSPTQDSFPFDLFRSRPTDTVKKAQKLPNPIMSLWKKPKSFPTIQPTVRIEKVDKNGNAVKPKAAAGAKTSSSSGQDSDVEALRNSLAAAAAQKNQSIVVDKLTSTKGGSNKTKTKFLSTMSSYSPSASRSLPSSPALNAVPSPSLGPTMSGSQQAMERAREQRFTLVHELAVQDRSSDYLKDKWEGKQDDFSAALRKVADLNEETQKWSMKKGTYWKELNVWEYDYDSREDRQKAIDNAIREFDRIRLGVSEPEWQKLLRREERGKGKCLSRLQANLAKGPAGLAPRIKVQIADDGRIDAKGNDSDAPKAKGEAMARSISQPLPAKPKKTERDVQTKRLLSTAKKPGSAKSSPNARAGSKGPTGKGGKILSEEFVVDSSDSSEDEALAVTSAAAKAKALPKVREIVVKPKTIPRPAPKPQVTKRPRDDDDSSSSSGTPLSKRLKPEQRREPIKAPTNPKHRPSDASQNSRNSSSNMSFKSKNTSPAKSSPLASSPPTNASDLDQADEPVPAPPPPKKRKMVEPEPEPEKAKRQRLSQELVSKAARFQAYYTKYEALHHEIAALENPPQEKMADLLDMRQRLKTMKSEIYRECPPEK